MCLGGETGSRGGAERSWGAGVNMIMYTAYLYELIKLFLLKKWLLMEHISKRRIAQECLSPHLPGTSLVPLILI